MDRRLLVRVSFAAVVVVAAAALLYGYNTTPDDAVVAAANQTDSPPAERTAVVPERSNVTVVTTDPPGGTDGNAAIAAFAPDGRPLYHNDTYGNYFDVDPDPEGSLTVLYVAGSRYDPCPDRLQARANGTFSDGCAEVAIERANLSTGDTDRLYTAVTGWDIWHDVDRVGPDRLLVADIAEDRAFLLNTTTGEVGWEWRAESDLDRNSSGGQSGDWTHINDVEALADGRVMVSLRNHDRVAFIEPGAGLQENWTLGSEDAYGILYEQHNPDYIPESQGGSAVLVADSENNRVVEYQRTDGGWDQSWTWQDERLRWPRDADRLPGGHTLVTDSQGDRVFELTEGGEVVWQINVSTPYEAERLGTGDESATGRSRRAIADNEQRAAGTGGGRTTGFQRVVAFLEGPALNGLLYVAPGWMTLQDIGVAFALCVAALSWGACELYWSSVRLRSLLPR